MWKPIEALKNREKIAELTQRPMDRLLFSDGEIMTVGYFDESLNQWIGENGDVMAVNVDIAPENAFQPTKWAELPDA